METYSAKKWPSLRGLRGISDNTLDMHFGLYEGYVKNSNLLCEQIADLQAAGKAKGAEPAFAEITRRLGFEFNGMRLHEYYFDNLTASGTEMPSSGALYDALGSSYGSIENWRADFAAVGGMRGVGWAIAYLDPSNGRVVNTWVSLHEDGNFAGFVPVLVMDVWEHAFLLDYKPSERGKYIEAFFENVDWSVVAKRLPGK